MKSKRFPIPCQAMTEKERLLRAFVTAAQNAVKGEKPAAIMVAPETLLVLLTLVAAATPAD